VYLVDDALHVDQPLTVSRAGQQSAAWMAILRAIERERTVIRSRAAERRPTTAR
jgi:hypothetical protein